MVIVICEDEVSEQEKLLQLIRDHPRYEESFDIIAVETAEALLAKKKNIDLLFFDIYLGGMKGIEAAKTISEQQPACRIVLVSGYGHYITEAYHTDVCQFLLKPLRPDIFEREFAFCLDQYERLEACYCRKCQNGMTSIKKSEVVYLESRKRIICAYMVNGEQYWYYGKLSDEAAFLKDSGFVQCQRAFIVNMAYVQSISNEGVRMTAKNKDGQVIIVPFSRDKKKYMESVLRKYIAGLM